MPQQETHVPERVTHLEGELEKIYWLAKLSIERLEREGRWKHELMIGELEGIQKVVQVALGYTPK